jgi:transposase
MFFTVKKYFGVEHLVVLKSIRVNKKPTNKIIHDFGKLEDLKKSGLLNKLVEIGVKLTDEYILISKTKDNKLKPTKVNKFGPVMVFEHIWKKLSIPFIINRLAKERKFKFNVERIIFASVLQRLINPGSDRSIIEFIKSYQIKDADKILLHQCYRTMQWLGEPVDEEDTESTEQAQQLEPENTEEKQTEKKQKPAKLAKCIRCNKDILEEGIYKCRRNLLTQVRLVFFDTTSLFFYGEGGKELGQRGHSKDHRPECNQVVVGMAIDDHGYPICTEIWPGNTADVTTLVPIANKLKERFSITNVCIVADRGMISQNTIDTLNKIGWSYIFGVKMRNYKEINDVLADKSDFIEIVGERLKTHDRAPLQIKEVIINDKRYIICLNEEERRKDVYTRQNIQEALEKAVNTGLKPLIGNRGYKRFVKSGNGTFFIDYDKIKEDSKYDGIYILITNTKLPSDQVALQYKQLLTVENIFRTTKSLLDTRPIYHSNDNSIRGHIWISYLAILLRKYLIDALNRIKPENKPASEWKNVIEDLDLLFYSEFCVDQKRLELRSKAEPEAINAFKALGLKLPKNVKINDIEAPQANENE